MDPIQIKAPMLGVRADLDPEEIPPLAMSNSENVIYRDGDFRVRPGFRTLGGDVNERPMGYTFYPHQDGNNRAILGTTAALYKLTGGGWSSLAGTALTGGATDHVIFRTFSKASATWLLATNGADDLKKWDGSAATYLSAGGSPPKARTMMVLADRIVLGNLLSGGTVSGVAIDVSANKDFDSGWGNVLVALLADTEGPIMSMEEMGTLNGAILKTDAVYMLIAQGGTNPFRIQWIRSGVSGPASPKLSAKLGDGSIAMAGKDGLVSIFDGSNIRPMPYAIQKYIMSTANLDNFNRGWMVYDRDRRELWIGYPLIGGTDVNGGVIIRMDNGECYPFRFGSHSMTAAGKLATTTGLTIGQLNVPIGSLTGTIGSLATTAALSRMCFGDVGGQTFEERGTTDDGSAIPFFWEPPIVGQSERYHTVQRIRHRFKPTSNTQSVTVRLGKRNQGGNITYGNQRTLNLNSSRRLVSGYHTSAEYSGLKFSGNATEEIVYQGSAVYAKQRGRR